MSIGPSIIAAVAAKYGLAIARKKGWLPKNYYLGQAMKELQQDNLENAIHHWQVASGKNPDGLEILAVQEIIESEIDLRITLLEERIQFLEKKKRGLGKQRFWSGLKAHIPFAWSRDLHQKISNRLQSAMVAIDEETGQFLEGISVLKGLKDELYAREWLGNEPVRPVFGKNLDRKQIL
jgi:hypothetical protein